MNKFKAYLGIILGIVIVGYFFYQIFMRAKSDHVLKSNTVHIKAIIIEKKNYEPHSYVTHEFTYSYMFIVNGKKYMNNSHEAGAEIGDSIDIEYSKGNPGFNRSLHPTD